MDDRFNTIAGWTLFAGICALGFSSLSGKVFHADDPELHEGQEPGYFIDAPEDAGGEAEMTIEEALNLETVSVAAGEAVFAKCTACHTPNQGGANGIGPNLYGVMGSGVGQHAAGFAYSSALSGIGGTWGWQNMSEWLKSPKAFAPGTKMSFAGLSNIEDRASVALYLNSLGGNLPVPEFVPAEEPAEGEGEIGVDGAGEGPGATEGSNPSAVEAAGAMGDEQPVAAGNAATTNDGGAKTGE